MLIAVGASLAAGPCSALAQQLEEIVVTATKRPKSVQDIPVSIATVSGESIRQDVIRGIEELSVRVPNLTVSSGLTTDNIHIRGIGSGTERSFEQAVGMFIDNVYMPRSRQYRSPFLDVERVEVVRGPQAVLFGLNSTAGAIAVHSARSRPGDASISDITAEYEVKYGGTGLTAIFGGSPSESLGLRIAAKTIDSGDGYWTNNVTGADENALDDTVVRASIVWESSASTTLDLKVEYAEFSRDGNVDELFTSAGAMSDGDDVLNWVRGQDASLLPLYPQPQSPGFEGESLNIAANLEFAVGDGTVTGIVGYSDYDWEIYLDLDSTPLPILDSGIIEPYEQTSVELRYTSPVGQPVEFLIGAYFHTSELSNDQPNLIDGTTLVGSFGFPVAGFDAGRLWSNGKFTQDEDVSSVFGTLAWNISETLQIRGGVRYVNSKKEHTRIAECLVRRSDGTFDDLDLTGNPNDALLSLIGFCPTVVTPPRQSRSSDNVMPEISLQWSASGDTMLYGKASTSAKSGGFVASTIIIPGFFEYDDETGLGLEAGLKTSFADGAGIFNIAVFRSEYEDLQLNSFDPDTAASIITNAGKAMVQGIEFDLRWAAADWLTLGGSLAYLDTEFTRFDAGPCYPGEPMNPDGFSCNKTGSPLPFSPEWSGNLSADISAPIGANLQLLGGIFLAYSGNYLTNGTLDPLGRQSSYSKIDARIGIGGADGRWSISLIGKNVTDEVVNNFTEAFLGVYRGYIQAPRTIWIQARYSVGGE